VILLGRTLAKVQAVAEELGAPHFAVECDVGNPDSVRTAFATVAERHPKIDVLINNAGIFEPFTLAEASDAQILGSMTTNLAGPIFCARSALPLFGGSGHIIKRHQRIRASAHADAVDVCRHQDRPRFVSDLWSANWKAPASGLP